MTEPRDPHEATRSDEHAALIAAAASDDLSAADRRAYDALSEADPTVRPETEELRAVLRRVGTLPGWSDPAPDPALAGRVLGVRGAGGRRPLAQRVGLLAAAAALLVLGGLGGAILGDRLGDDPASTAGPTSPAGPPGTLGAVEPIEFDGEPADVDISAELIAHTWGTETVLDMAGWSPGEPYRLVLVGTDGALSESGTFRGSEVTIVCRMNGALLREEVDLVEIRDADGRVVARSDVPSVSASG